MVSIRSFAKRFWTIADPLFYYFSAGGIGLFFVLAILSWECSK